MKVKNIMLCATAVEFLLSAWAKELPNIIYIVYRSADSLCDALHGRHR